MKKLLKSGIYGSINSTWCPVCYRKVNICGYCSLNSTWTVTAFCQNAWIKKKKKNKTKTQNADVDSKRRSKHTLTPLQEFKQAHWLGKSGGNLICNCRPSFTSTNNCWHNYSYYYYYFRYILYLSRWVINVVFHLIVHGSSYQLIASNQIEIETKRRKKDPSCFVSMDVKG